MRLTILFAALAVASACGQPPGPPVAIANFVVFEPVPGSQVATAYFDIHNRSDRPVTIVSVTSPEFSRVEMHETILEDGIARMRAMTSLALAENSSVAFEPGGRHLMLFGAKSKMTAGTPVTVKFHDDANGLVSLSTTVRSRSESGE